MSDRPLTELVARRVLDADLAALLWLAAERGVPLVVASTDRAAAEELRAAVAALMPADRHAADMRLPGGTVVAGSLEQVLGRLGSATAGEVADEARDLGVVVVVDAGAVGGRPADDAAPGAASANSQGAGAPSAMHVATAHYIRPVERDGGGHLQRRPPALLSAWDRDRGAHDAFHWAVSDELATRVGMDRAEFEDAHLLRTRLVADAVAADAHDPTSLRRHAQHVTLSGGDAGHLAGDARH